MDAGLWRQTLRTAAQVHVQPVLRWWLKEEQPTARKTVVPRRPRPQVFDVQNASVDHRFCPHCTRMIENIGPQAAGTIECPHCHNRIPADDV